MRCQSVVLGLNALAVLVSKDVASPFAAVKKRLRSPDYLNLVVHLTVGSQQRRDGIVVIVDDLIKGNKR